MLLLPTELIASSILRGWWLASSLRGRQILDRNLAGICSLSRHYFNNRAPQSPNFLFFGESGKVGNWYQEVTLYLVG